MKIENLYEGMMVKNYKELCALLEVEVKPTGNPRKSQQKDFAQYFDFNKIQGGQKIMINKIYENKKDRVDLRKLGGRSKYVNEIGDILVDYLYEKGKSDNKYSTILSLGQILQVLGMVNKTYSIGCRHRTETAEVLDVQLFSVHYFFNSTRSEFRKIIERALNNLQNRRVLNWNKCIRICEKKEDFKIYRTATQQEVETIINVEKRVLDSLEVRNMQELFFGGKIRKFQKLVKEQLGNKWLFYFYAYDLTIGDEAIKIEKKFIENSKKTLNKKSKDKAMRVLKTENGKDEYKLVEILIDLLKYDLEIDNCIKEMYEINQTRRFVKTYKAFEEYNNQLEKIDSEFYGDIEMSDYFGYILSTKIEEEKDNKNETLEDLFG